MAARGDARHQIHGAQWIRTEMPIWDGVNITTTIIPIDILGVDYICQIHFYFNQPLIDFIFSVLSFLGGYNVFYGYRYFRPSMFVTGFSFASSIVYAICIGGDLMTNTNSTIVSACAGILFGLITMMVQFMGLFISGLHSGVLKGASILAFCSKTLTDDMPTAFWISILVCLICGLTSASLNVIWKKGLTIVSTSVYGGALVAMSLDHFCLNCVTVKWICGRVLLQPFEELPCSLSWVILAVWPITSISGIFIQTFYTATGIYHEKTIETKRDKQVSIDPSWIELMDLTRGHPNKQPSTIKHEQTKGSAAQQHRSKAVPLTRQQKAELRQRKYRYLYQMRTAHGDVISQSYVQALQQKKNTGEPWSTHGMGECSTLQSDSTHLTVLATDIVTQDSDTDEVNPIGARR